MKVLRVLVLLTNINFLLAEDPIVQLDYGTVRGTASTTIANKPIYSFYGIPYAAPPIGDLRFEPPQPPLTWDGVYDAVHSEVRCYQTARNDNKNAKEDCLLLSVHTPQLPSENSELLPVMFFIHGGGFVDGSGVGDGFDLFINNDVVVVSTNYRLGVFGFISTGDEVIPGNNGLKDQRFALLWTRDNIAKFGGDPDRITIFGASAGSASVAYHLLNQDNTGLFQGAILQSGSFLSPWAYQRKAREIAFKTASFLNSTFETNRDSQTLLDFLKTVDAAKLDAATGQYKNFENSPQDVEISQGFYYAPVIEVKNADAFLTKKMYMLLKAGNVVKVPIIIGINSEENLLFNSNPNSFKQLMATYDENLSWIVPNDMGVSDETGRTVMGTKIRNLYTGGEPLADNLGKAIGMCSDTSFTRSVIKHAELYSSFAATYFYQFSYDGKMGGSRIYYEGGERVSHGEDSRYLFCRGGGCQDDSYPEEDRTTRQRLVKIWTDFAKYKNPTPEPSGLLQNVTWPPVNTENGDFYYLDINTNLEVKNHPKEATYRGWNDLYDTLTNQDFDTY